MTRRRSHNARVRFLTGRGWSRTKVKDRPNRGAGKRRRTRRGVARSGAPSKELRTRVDTEQAEAILENYRILFGDRVFLLGELVEHPKRGPATVVGIEVRGAGGWDKVDYVLRTGKGSVLRMRIQDAAGRGLRTAG